MTAPTVVVTGTGTGIGKTHLTAALLGAWARVLVGRGVSTPRIAGIKPVESGVTAGGPSDRGTLEQASTFHVKHPPPYILERPVSPHLAAADEGRTLELSVIEAYVNRVRANVDGLAVELAGGLFSPLGPALSNADVAARLGGRVLLVAPDRLGVLHDVAAATRAASALPLRITGIALVQPPEPDASTGTNAHALALVTDVPVLGVIPRASVGELAASEDLDALLRRLLSLP